MALQTVNKFKTPT